MKRAEEIAELNPYTAHMSVEEMLAKIENEVVMAMQKGKFQVSVRLGISYLDDVEKVKDELESLGYAVEHYHWDDYDYSIQQQQELKLRW